MLFFGGGGRGRKKAKSWTLLLSILICAFVTGATPEAREKCFNLTGTELLETRSCDVVTCPTYTWHVGNWSSCVPYNNMGEWA